MSLTTDDLKIWIDRMTLAKGIKNYTIDISGNSLKGDGYLGEVTFATVKTGSNGLSKEYQLVIKSAKKNAELRKQSPIREAYDREIYMYSKIFPTFEKFQIEKNIEKPFNNVPKCYSVCMEQKKEALILQNLKSVGFELHDRKKPMNLNHFHMVFTHYARWHALSLAFKHQNPDCFETLTLNMTDVLSTFVLQGKMRYSFINTFKDCRELLKRDGHLEAYKKYENFDSDIVRLLTRLCREKDPTFVITHGDCWNNNMMFKYDNHNKTKPIDMRFLDFQLSRVASPIIDLSYNLYSCCDEKILNNFDFILQAYHSSLSDFAAELGTNIDDIFPFSKLKEDWKTYGKFGIAMACLVLKISLCDSDEAPDLADAAEKGEGSIELDVKLKDDTQFNERFKAVLLHFAERFL